MQDIKIDWDVFTEEEKVKIKECLKSGRFEDMGAAIQIDDPVREYQIQNIKKVYVPKVNIHESKVKEDLADAENKNGGRPVIDSPEKEAEWQAKIDEEKAKQLADDDKKEAKKVAAEAKIDAAGSDVKACCGAKGKRHKKDCPENKKV